MNAGIIIFDYFFRNLLTDYHICIRVAFYDIKTVKIFCFTLIRNLECCVFDAIVSCDKDAWLVIQRSVHRLQRREL